MVTVVGLGNGSISEIAVNAIQTSDKVFARSSKLMELKEVKKLVPEVQCFDCLFEEDDDFDTLYAKIAREVEEKGGVYLTEGSGATDTVAKLLIEGGAKLIAGVPKGEELKVHANGGGTVTYSLTDFLEDVAVSVSYFNLLITDVDSCVAAGELKIKLAKEYDDEETVIFYNGKSEKEIPLYELDRQKEYGYSTCVFIAKKPCLKKKKHDIFEDLYLLKYLRSDKGCPWDRAQTMQSIRANVLEEAYEVVEAIDLNDADKLTEEIGDLLLQALFLAEMGESKEILSLNDVTSGLATKLITRHTHIFGNDKVTDAKEALAMWDKNKIKEKGQKTVIDTVESIPTTLPALMKAEKVQKKVAKVNFDFENEKDVLAKVEEELAEFLSATEENREIEGGDLLFSVVNLLRWFKIEPEVALLNSTNKFVERFEKVFREAEKQGRKMEEMTTEEIDVIYKRVKSEN